MKICKILLAVLGLTILVVTGCNNSENQPASNNANNAAAAATNASTNLPAAPNK